MTARVMVQVTVDKHLIEDFERTFRQIAPEIEKAPGLIQHQVLQSFDDPEQYIMLTEWEKIEDFDLWEATQGHRDLVRPLAAMWHGARMRKYRVVL